MQGRSQGPLSPTGEREVFFARTGYLSLLPGAYRLYECTCEFASLAALIAGFIFALCFDPSTVFSLASFAAAMVIYLSYGFERFLPFLLDYQHRRLKSSVPDCPQSPRMVH